MQTTFPKTDRVTTLLNKNNVNVVDVYLGNKQNKIKMFPFSTGPCKSTNVKSTKREKGNGRKLNKIITNKSQVFFLKRKTFKTTVLLFTAPRIPVYPWLQRGCSIAWNPDCYALFHQVSGAFSMAEPG